MKRFKMLFLLVFLLGFFVAVFASTFRIQPTQLGIGKPTGWPSHYHNELQDLETKR